MGLIHKKFFFHISCTYPHIWLADEDSQVCCIVPVGTPWVIRVKNFGGMSSTIKAQPNLSARCLPQTRDVTNIMRQTMHTVFCETGPS